MAIKRVKLWHYCVNVLYIHIMVIRAAVLCLATMKLINIIPGFWHHDASRSF